MLTFYPISWLDSWSPPKIVGGTWYKTHRMIYNLLVAAKRLNIKAHMPFLLPYSAFGAVFLLELLCLLQRPAANGCDGVGDISRCGHQTCVDSALACCPRPADVLYEFGGDPYPLSAHMKPQQPDIQTVTAGSADATQEERGGTGTHTRIR